MLLDFTPKRVFAPLGDRPIIDNLADTDSYKITMNQMYRHRSLGYSDVHAKFSFINRDRDLRLTDVIDIDELEDQLNAARQASFTDLGLTALRGTPIDPSRGRRMYSGWFVDEMQPYRLPEFEVIPNFDTGQIDINFLGLLHQVSPWEIPCMSIVSELFYASRMRSHLQNGMSEREFAAFYVKMFSRFVGRIELLKEHPEVRVAEMGTRRRHSGHIQQLHYAHAREICGNQIIGTSNIAMSIKNGTSDAIGTNGHEVPMVKAAITEGDTDEEIFNSPYEVIRDWYSLYPEIMVGLPDTYGTTAFLNNVPEDIPGIITGFRSDSKDPVVAIDELQQWWVKHDIPKERQLGIFSDGFTFPGMVDFYYPNQHKADRIVFGNGTMFTNDCAGLIKDEYMRPINIVCKVTAAGRSVQEMRDTVKLGDHFGKRTGDRDRVKRFEGIFGTEGHAGVPVV